MVGAGIAGLATAAALHKVLTMYHLETCREHNFGMIHQESCKLSEESIALHATHTLYLSSSAAARLAKISKLTDSTSAHRWAFLSGCWSGRAGRAERAAP